MAVAAADAKLTNIGTLLCSLVKKVKLMVVISVGNIWSRR